MEKRSVVFVLLCAVPLWVTARNSPLPIVCPSDDITLATQAEVDAFAATYSCTELRGTLTISGDDITNLQGLSAITSIGTLFISGNTALTNLDGLSNITTIGNTCLCFAPGLTIENNPALTNLHGLSSLSSIEGSLYMFNNGQVVDLEGLENLTSIGEMLHINNNANLTSINALSAVTTVGVLPLSSQGVEISNNPLLTRISILNELTILPGNMRIVNNASLTEVDGFSSLTQITGENAGVTITGNPLLTNLNGFAALNSIDGSRRGAVITIADNASLTNMNGFSSLTSINGGIVGGLIISNNQALREVDGLSQLINITGGNFFLSIMDNPMLNQGCGLFPLLDNNGVGGGLCESSTCPAITISGNGPNCTREAILSGGICSPVVACPVDKVLIAENINGCNSLSTRIIIQNPEPDVTYTLHDNQTNSVLSGPLDGTLGLPTGLITQTRDFNVVATNTNSGCEVVMSTRPIVTINPLPMDKVVMAVTVSGCGFLSTSVFIEDYEPAIDYTLRNNENNSVIAGPSPGSSGLATGTITITSSLNILARNPTTGCESQMSTEPLITIFPLPQDYIVVAENDSIMAGTSTHIMVPEGEPAVMYTLRREGDNSIVAGPLPGPPVLCTGILFETTTYNVLATDAQCEKELSTKVIVTVVAPDVVMANADNTTADMSFYPNPSNGEFHIQFAHHQSGQYHLSLYNLAGSLVKETSIDTLDDLDTAQIDLKPLPTGTYFVSITGPGIYIRRRVEITN